MNAGLTQFACWYGLCLGKAYKNEVSLLLTERTYYLADNKHKQF